MKVIIPKQNSGGGMMGKIAKIIRKYYGAILDTYYYIDGELEKTAYKMPEEEIIELIDREVMIHPKETISKTGDNVLNYYNEMKQNLEELKED